MQGSVSLYHALSRSRLERSEPTRLLVRTEISGAHVHDGLATAFEEEDSEKDGLKQTIEIIEIDQIAEEHGAYQTRWNSGGTEERDQKEGITWYGK